MRARKNEVSAIDLVSDRIAVRHLHDEVSLQIGRDQRGDFRNYFLLYFHFVLLWRLVFCCIETDGQRFRK